MSVQCKGILDEFLLVKHIKLIQFLKHHNIDTSHFYDIEKPSSIETAEDMYYFAHLSCKLNEMLVGVNDKIYIIMQTWQLIVDLYEQDESCSYGYGDLIEILLNKIIV